MTCTLMVMFIMMATVMMMNIIIYGVLMQHALQLNYIINIQYIKYEIYSLFLPSFKVYLLSAKYFPIHTKVGHKTLTFYRYECTFYFQYIFSFRSVEIVNNQFQKQNQISPFSKNFVFFIKAFALDCLYNQIFVYFQIQSIFVQGVFR